MPTFTQVVPILNVQNVEVSLAYYVEVLGFEESWCWGDPVTFGGARTGTLEIQFCRGSQGNPGTWLPIEVEDVDALHDLYRSRGANIIQGPTTFPWHVREMNVADPDGHRIRFSTGTSDPPDAGAIFPD